MLWGYKRVGNEKGGVKGPVRLSTEGLRVMGAPTYTKCSNIRLFGIRVLEPSRENQNQLSESFELIILLLERAHPLL